MTQSRYELGNDWERAKERLTALERIHDPLSIDVLDRIGVSRGWRCLELGSGAGSMTQWLCDRVGADGHVASMDIDARFLLPLDLPNLEVREVDVVSEPLEEEAFDLVFTRLTLQHISERDAVLVKLVRSLKPGGWILVHDLDSSGSGGMNARPAVPVSDELRVALEHVAAAAARLDVERGRDMTYGGRIYGQMVALGLKDVEAEFLNRVIRAESPAGRLAALNSEQMREQFISTGLVSSEELDLINEVSRQPTFGRWGAGIIRVRGHK
jgi:SAM-dependent methyltransferase